MESTRTICTGGSGSRAPLPSTTPGNDRPGIRPRVTGSLRCVFAGRGTIGSGWLEEAAPRGCLPRRSFQHPSSGLSGCKAHPSLDIRAPGPPPPRQGTSGGDLALERYSFAKSTFPRPYVGFAQQTDLHHPSPFECGRPPGSNGTISELLASWSPLRFAPGLLASAPGLRYALAQALRAAYALVPPPADPPRRRFASLIR